MASPAVSAAPRQGNAGPWTGRRTLRTFADYQDKLADASQSDWLTQMMKAQANFTRDVVSAVGEVSRSTLKK